MLFEFEVLEISQIGYRSNHEAVVFSIWKFVTDRQRHFEILNVSFTNPFEAIIYLDCL